MKKLSEINKSEKNHTHIGVYGLIIQNDKILLIKKANGPYKDLLDLPGGSFEFGERPEETLKRELKEETNIEIEKAVLFDSDSVTVNWNYGNQKIITHHICIFYKITEYKNKILKTIALDEKNDDSLGSEFYEISKLKEKKLSSITILELKKLGYQLNK